MSYTKRTWDCGDKITADALNHMEQGIYDAQDKGYECVATLSLVTEETLSPTDDGGHFVASTNYRGFITSNKLKVTINGTAYILDKVYATDELSAYESESAPILIVSNYATPPASPAPLSLTFDEAGTYTVKIETYAETLETSECFEKARGYSCENTVFYDGEFQSVDVEGYNEADLQVSTPLHYDVLHITFDDVEYECEAMIQGAYQYCYGAPNSDGYDFSEYPFMLNGDNWNIVTKTAGSHYIRVELDAIDVSNCFAGARGYKCDVQIIAKESVETEVVSGAVEAIGYFNAYFELPNEAVTVIFNGKRYSGLKIDEDGGIGAPFDDVGDVDFTDYPFRIQFADSDSPSPLNPQLQTSSPGEYSVVVELNSVATTPCFENAVSEIAGYTCGEKLETLFNQDSCTAETAVGNFATISLGTKLDLPSVGSKVVVTLDGARYVCEVGIGKIIGAKQSAPQTYDWSTYPFSGNAFTKYFFVPSAGTHSLKIEKYVATANITECFEAAVKKVSGTSVDIMEPHGTYEYTYCGFNLPTGNTTVAANSVAQITMPSSAFDDISLDAYWMIREIKMSDQAAANLVLVDYYIEYDSNDAPILKLRVRNMSSQSVTLSSGNEDIHVVAYAIDYIKERSHNYCFIASDNCSGSGDIDPQ